MAREFHSTKLDVLREFCTTAEIPVFVCLGCQQRENGKTRPARRLRYTRKVSRSGESLHITAEQIRCFLGKVCDVNDPYWRAMYPNGDWQELNREEIKKEGNMMGTASA